MEIIVTDERDERFIEICSSFGCKIDDPQVVLLLNNYKKQWAAPALKYMTASQLK